MTISNNPALGSPFFMSLEGFANRAQRIRRRMERDTFREIIMPAAYVFGGLGAIGLLVSVTLGAETGTLITEAVGVCLGLLAMPVALLLFRVVRGHYSKALEEP